MSSIRVSHGKSIRIHTSQGGSIGIRPIGLAHKSAKSESMNQQDQLAPERKDGSGLSELQNSLANLKFVDNTERPANSNTKLPGARERKRNISFTF